MPAMRVMNGLIDSDSAKIWAPYVYVYVVLSVVRGLGWLQRESRRFHEGIYEAFDFASSGWVS